MDATWPASRKNAFRAIFPLDALPPDELRFPMLSNAIQPARVGSLGRCLMAATIRRSLSGRESESKRQERTLAANARGRMPSARNHMASRALHWTGKFV